MGDLEYVITNISGFVRQVRNKIRGSNYLFPVYEALINSIQAIKSQSGTINITIIRAEAQLTTDGSKTKDPNIIGFEIIDNGIGFDEKNYASFKESYTEHKIELGCKGIGRFVGLAAFRKIEVDSIFQGDNGKYYRRTFVFSEKGIEKPELVQVDASSTKTIIKFSSIYDKFLKNTSLSEVCDYLLRHIIVYFVTGTPPKILVTDSTSNKLESLNELFEKSVSVEDDIENISIKGETFELYFLKTYFKNFHKHLIHYCGNQREVKDIAVSTLIPKFINERIKEENSSDTYFLSVYVTGQYLNAHVDDFRNAFTFTTKRPDNELFDVISLEELNSEVAWAIQQRYSKFLEGQNAKVLEETTTYVFGQAREYEHLLSHPELLSNIKPNSSTEELEVELHKANFEFSRKQKAKVNQFLSTKVENIEEYKESLAELLNNQNEIGKSNLVKYMYHRKAVLKLFEKFLEIQKSGLHRTEAEIHDILFERKKTSNHLSFNEHNLWILDERLAYSRYISSDLPVGDTTKPDVFIYDKQFIFGDTKENIVIFELKRPSRTNYTEDEKDFGKQILKQVIDIITSGGGKDENGRNLNITETLPKFGFVIADMNNDQIKNHRLNGYKTTPKGSLFKYEEGVNLFIEILTYEQLKDDANLRHKAFFTHLGIDGI